MNKKRRMAQDKLNNVFRELSPASLAALYSPNSYKIAYTPQSKVVDDLLNELHTLQLQMVDEAVENSDCKEAKEIIKQFRLK